PNISIDYAILEKSDRIVMVEIDTRWSDVGAWAALPSLLGRDEDGNTLRARRVVCRDAHDLLVHAPGKVVAVIGASNLIVADTPDALLICDVERSEEVKAIVESLKGSDEEDVL
ncbi:MAG: mannose-1-phosphate guanylyltransferase, partial [Deltaproteobacteria bacterium]